MSAIQLTVKNRFAGYSSSAGFTSKHINFEVSGGEMLAIMGPSGAGKSTLIKSFAAGRDISNSLQYL